MTVSVQEIVNLPIFNTAKVRAGIDLLETRYVEWMSAMEGPVEHFVRKNEFILTTGMGCENDPDQLLQFVKEVYESEASALAIALGRYVFEIPEKVIQFAKVHQFVLLELPWELRFSDIQREAMRKIIKHQEIHAAKEQHTQKILIDFVIHGKDLSEMIKYIERRIDCSIVYADNKGRFKSSSTEPIKLISLWQESEEEGRVDMNEPSFRNVQQSFTREGLLLKKEIMSGARNLAQGYFIILFHDKKVISDKIVQIIENLSAATALWISREDAIVKAEIRLRNELIWGLAKHSTQEIDENTISRAKLFGYNLQLPFTCIVGYSEKFDAFSSNQEDNQGFRYKNIIYFMEEEVHYAAKVVNRHVAFTFDDDRLIIYLEQREKEQSKTHHFLDILEKKLSTLLPGVPFSWGIGMNKDGVMQFHRSYQRALSALEMSRKQKRSGIRIHFEDTQLNRLLLHLVHDEEVKKITHHTIFPLLEYEKKREMDLIDTFIAYDNQNGNVSQAARVLNLHRQSLLYRLKKIESLTNLSLDDPDDVFLLNISIKVWLTGALEVEGGEVSSY